VSTAEHATVNRAPRQTGVAVAVVIALLLVWRVVVTGYTALVAGSGGADASRAVSPLDTTTADAQWRARLARNPTDYPALVILALHLEQQGKIAEASAAMREALRLGPANERALLEAAAFHLRIGEERQALAILRRAVELNSTAAGSTWPIFAAALSSGRFDEFFAGAARDNVAWWPGFFNYACSAATDFGGVERAFAVRAAAGFATANERSCVIERLQRDNHWANAYQSWVNSLPQEQQRRIGFIFNGDFELSISNVGFDWIVTKQDGVNVDAQSIQGAHGRRALRIEFVRKRWSGVPVQQFLMLAPGKYRFEGRGRADGLDTWVGVQWGLYCRQPDGSTTRQLATSDRFRGTSDWVDFHDEFSVSTDCPVQVLRFELANPRQDVTTPGDVVTRLNGNVWFDDFRVRSLD
jgi:hypothetical protein